MLLNLGENHVRLAFRQPPSGCHFLLGQRQNTAAFIVGGKAISICMS